jgi:hypothetical protein
MTEVAPTGVTIVGVGDVDGIGEPDGAGIGDGVGWADHAGTENNMTKAAHAAPA